MLLDVVLLLVGFAVLVGGGELLVRGGGALARALGMSPLVVGLTVVAAATSAPELAVTLLATLEGSPGLAVGNVVGSNLANVLLVVGVAALLLPLAVGRQTLRVDLPVVIAVSALALLLVQDGAVGRLDGAVLLAVVAAHMTWTVRAGRRAERERAPREVVGDGEDDHGAAAGRGRGREVGRDLALVVAGVALLVGGSQALVTSAGSIAASLGVSDLVVGLTVVAVGTSLPELATAVIAIVRGQRDLGIGNVVGSNLFNVGGVLALTGLVTPGGVAVEAGARTVDLPLMLASTVLLLALALCASRVSRRDGALLLGGYVAYLAYVVLDATGSALLEPYVGAVLVALALVAVVVAVSVAREVRGRVRPVAA
ncbi:calcium/sodium antiporter [Pseudokineococcus marinus]|uniref:Calcium/sodium antiporter n=1 Tax=Pseudokineococcus marinus TaxID=351215 RepID=A0A849BSU3_9ACTN|nr:calcium/sodium antiporter [Pseudokineococcus marinus]NNH24037.1 calcium/sodium antiporter [Pseudokineococcus marinus]